LDVAAGESRHHNMSFIRVVVAVVVSEKQDIGWVGYENSSVVTDNRGGPGQSTYENVALIVSAIPIGVVEQADAADAVSSVFGIAAHLHDIHPSVFVE
jgi:hypothetical protein